MAFLFMVRQAHSEREGSLLRLLQRPGPGLREVDTGDGGSMMRYREAATWFPGSAECGMRVHKDGLLHLSPACRRGLFTLRPALLQCPRARPVRGVRVAHQRAACRPDLPRRGGWLRAAGGDRHRLPAGLAGATSGQATGAALQLRLNPFRPSAGRRSRSDPGTALHHASSG